MPIDASSRQGYFYPLGCDSVATLGGWNARFDALALIRVFMESRIDVCIGTVCVCTLCKAHHATCRFVLLEHRRRIMTGGSHMERKTKQRVSGASFVCAACCNRDPAHCRAGVVRQQDRIDQSGCARRRASSAETCCSVVSVCCRCVTSSRETTTPPSVAPSASSNGSELIPFPANPVLPERGRWRYEGDRPGSG